MVPYTPRTYKSFADKYDVIRPGLNDNMIAFIECEGMFMDDPDGLWQYCDGIKYLRTRFESDNSTVDLDPVDKLERYDPNVDYRVITAARREIIINRIHNMSQSEYEDVQRSCG